MSECEKISAVKEQSQICGSFLEWLQEKGVVLASYHEHDDELYPYRYSIETLLAEFFEIDLEKVEEETRAILEKLRQ